MGMLPVAALTLTAVLQHAGTYVVEFQQRLAGIVAEETYVQTSEAGARALPLRTELRSNLLLVRPVGAHDWVQFRDVFDVDGRVVRDRTERLTQLFLSPTPSARAQIERLLDESARYNLGDIVRNVNTPLFVLKVLEPANQPRFRFRVTRDRAPRPFASADGIPGAFRASTEVWVVEYEEKWRPTLIRTTEHKDLPIRGRFWIEPESGRVLMSELVADNRSIHAVIDVSYQSEPLLGLLVPIEMRESYDGRRSRSHTTAVATYGRFRQFGVSVTEEFLIKR
jgi:hypothetical protein